MYVGDWQDGIAHGHGSFSYNIGPRKGEEYKERIQISLMLTFICFQYDYRNVWRSSSAILICFSVRGYLRK